jgi:parallel beta-helix repeat protein
VARDLQRVDPAAARRGVRAACGSDPGRERENNEDRVLCDPERGIFAAIYGVGGESGGEVAAGIAHDTLHARLTRRTTDLERLIREAIALANRQIYERALAEPALHGMACVLTVALLDGDRALVGHVGDSRLYLLRQGSIRKVTSDHSPVGTREDAGEISEEEAMRHPRRNEIFRDVGSAPHGPDDEGFVEIREVPFDADSALLLCSDGLSDLVTSAQILATVESHAGDPDATVRELIGLANAAGGKDNISVVVVEGERFGRGRARGKAAAASGPSAATRPIRGAGYVRPAGARRWLDRLTSLPALFLYFLLTAAICFYAFREYIPFGPWAPDGMGGPGGPGGRTAPAAVLRVGAGVGTFSTIAEALAAAQPGETVEVAPGRYAGRVQMREGVALISSEPRGAVLTPSPDGGVGPVVDARNVRGALLAGFRIEAASENPFTVGLRLSGSAVEVEGVEITGAPAAGVEISGGDRSVLRGSVIQGNPGGGIRILESSAPRILENQILGNGKDPQSPSPGVEIAAGTRPQLAGNRIEDNGQPGGPQVVVADPALATAIAQGNTFGALAPDKAVQGAEPSPPRIQVPPGRP